MRWHRFSRFDIHDPDNVYLYVKRRGPLFWILVGGGLFAALLWFINGALDPDWAPHDTRRTGAWLVALLALMPLPARAVLLACLLALVAEALYRSFYRMYNGRCAFVIGPSGVARLDPWIPCALGWDEVREIRREIPRRSWKRRTPSLEFAFLSRPARAPHYLPEWLWQRLPTRLTGRRIEVSPRAVGHSDDQLLWLIRRFAGPVTIVDHDADFG